MPTKKVLSSKDVQSKGNKKVTRSLQITLHKNQRFNKTTTLLAKLSSLKLASSQPPLKKRIRKFMFLIIFKVHYSLFRKQT